MMHKENTVIEKSAIVIADGCLIAPYSNIFRISSIII